MVEGSAKTTSWVTDSTAVTKPEPTFEGKTKEYREIALQ